MTILSEFDRGMLVWPRRTGHSVSEIVKTFDIMEMYRPIDANCALASVETIRTPARLGKLSELERDMNVGIVVIS